MNWDNVLEKGVFGLILGILGFILYLILIPLQKLVSKIKRKQNDITNPTFKKINIYGGWITLILLVAGLIFWIIQQE